MTFGAFISTRRKEAKLNLRDTAKHLGISNGYLCDIEQGRRPAPEGAFVERMPIQGADEKEQFAILTKSFGEFIGLKNSAYVDINNCPFAPQLLNRGFAKDTGLYKESGFCSYPLWTFEETVLKETGGEKYERYARAYDEYMESSFIGMMGAEDETGEEICTGMMM